MQEERLQFDSGTAATARKPERRPAPGRALEWTLRSWRPAGTVVVVLLALLLTWHVINGKHGLSVWHQKRAEDRQLRKEIEELEQENARLHQRVERLKSDPDAIEHEAREKLHYAKPDEVIYALPAPPPEQTQGAAPGK